MVSLRKSFVNYVGDVLLVPAIHYVMFWIMYFISLFRGKTLDLSAEVSGSRPVHKRWKGSVTQQCQIIVYLCKWVYNTSK